MARATQMAETVAAAEGAETARALTPRDLGIGRLFEAIRSVTGRAGS